MCASAVYSGASPEPTIAGMHWERAREATHRSDRGPHTQPGELHGVACEQCRDEVPRSGCADFLVAPRESPPSYTATGCVLSTTLVHLPPSTCLRSESQTAAELILSPTEAAAQDLLPNTGEKARRALADRLS